jgi:invasion associated locus B (IalB) protein
MTGIRFVATAAIVLLFAPAAFAQQPAAPAQQPAKPPAAAQTPKPSNSAQPAKPSNAAQPAKPAAAAQPPKAAAAPAGEVQPTLLGQYGDWGAYAATPGGKKLCFALAKPKITKTEPAGRPRDPSFVFVSTRPAENVRNEVSIMIGYPFKTSSDATAEVGSAKFAMYTQNDGAWIKNVAEEARMVDAMRKGADLTVKGTSGRGTTSTDQYSLKGLAQALDKIEQECK